MNYSIKYGKEWQILQILQDIPLKLQFGIMEISQKSRNERGLNSGKLRYVEQLFWNDNIKSFAQLSEEFEIPRQRFFQYLQLRHAIQVQAHTSEFKFNNSKIILLLKKEGKKQVLLSKLYETLNNKFKEKVAVPARIQWERDLGPLSDAQWSEALSAIPQVSLFTTQKLTQLFILHTTYYTPEKLFKMKCRESPLCPRCRGAPANLIHMLWRCDYGKL